MDLDFEIRNMEMEDKKDFYELIDQVNQIDDLGYSITEEWLEHVIENFSDGIFLIYQAYKLIGIGTCMINGIYLNQANFNIIISPDHRSLGLGRKLYSKLEDFAKSKQVDLVETFVKERLNRSLDFAEKLKFNINMYSWTMEIDLSQSEIELDKKENLTFRAIRVDDGEDYRNIILHGFDDELSEDSLREMLKDPSITVYFLEEKNRLIGSLTVQKREDIGSAYIYDIVVFSQERKKGFGSYMIRSALKSLQGEGIEKVSLLVTNENKNALKIYREIGFEEKDIDIIMIKNI